MTAAVSSPADPTFSAIASDLDLSSVLDATPKTTGAVKQVMDAVLAAQRRGGTQLLGLHLAFIALAEALAAEKGMESLPGHSTFDNTKKRAGGTKAVDTLTILIAQSNGTDKKFGIRRWVNLVIEVFKGPKLRRTGYPSSPMQHTKRWADWTMTLDAILGMTRAERRALAEALYDEVLKLPKDIPRVVPRAVQDPFVQVIRDFPRTKQTGERGGAALQGLAYGFVCADAPDLTARSAKVHTGARRAGLIGDVDGYNGPDLQLAVEVKDKHLDDFAELVDFLSNLSGHPETTAFVICLSVEDNVRKKCAKHAISILTIEEMAEQVRLWTVGKQTRAVRETLAYYSIIEGSPALANRFRAFLTAGKIDYRVT